MTFALAILVVALSGFIALSYEILWFRVYSFTTGGNASAFGVMLGAYLLGIAVGSLFVWRWSLEQATPEQAPRPRTLAVLIAVSNLAAFLVAPYVAWEVRQANYAWSLVGLSMAAGLMGAVLPLVAHFGIRPDDRAGKRLSYLYLSNILGSASGSLLTGFVLMQHLALGRISLLLLWLGLGLSALLLVGVRWPLRAGAFAAAVCLAALAEPYLHDGLFEKLLFKERWSEDKRFSRLVENRSGVIAVRSDGAMFGGGMYDGCANVDLVDNRNNIVRAYALAAMRDRFPDVLMVGLASGSWAQVIASTPGVDHLTVVEINPGYLGLVGEHAEVASLLTNPNVENVVDDGRRWLMAHPERRFDLIAQNTTWYWRGHASNLLSAEYLQIVKAHLKPGGVFYVNTNFSQAALKTACTSFAHGFGIFNVLAVSDDEVTMDRERWRRALVSWRIDGKVVLNLDDSRHRDRLASVLSIEPEPCSVLLGAAASSTIITDDNMAGEWSRPWWLMPESDKLVLPAAHTPP